MVRPVLVTGFGAFPGVTDNPTAVLARAAHGAVVAGHPVVSEVLPVTWRGGPEQAITLAREHNAVLVLGLGVAVKRTQVCVETVSYQQDWSRSDAAGALPPTCEGPLVVPATLDCERLARALNAELSTDPGRYVCNAWLYQVTQELDCPVGFVHVPLGGLEVSLLFRGIEALLLK